MVRANSFLTSMAAFACVARCESQSEQGLLRGPITRRRLLATKDSLKDTHLLEPSQQATLQRRVDILDDYVDYLAILDVKYICRSELVGGFGALEQTLLTYHNIIVPPCQATFTQVTVIDFEEPECCRTGPSCESYFQPPNAQDDSVTTTGGGSAGSLSRNFISGGSSTEGSTFNESYTTGETSSTVSLVTVENTTYTTTTVLSPTSLENSTGTGSAALSGPETLPDKSPEHHRELQRQATTTRVKYNTRAKCSVILQCPPTSAPAERSINRRMNEDSWGDMAPSITPVSYSPVDASSEDVGASLDNFNHVGASASSNDVSRADYREKPALCECGEADTSVTTDCETVNAPTTSIFPEDVTAPTISPVSYTTAPTTSPSYQIAPTFAPSGAPAPDNIPNAENTAPTLSPITDDSNGTDSGILTTDRPLLVALLNGAGFVYVRDADYVVDQVIQCEQDNVCLDDTQGNCCGINNCVCKSNPFYIF